MRYSATLLAITLFLNTTHANDLDPAHKKALEEYQVIKDKVDDFKRQESARIAKEEIVRLKAIDPKTAKGLEDVLDDIRTGNISRGTIATYALIGVAATVAIQLWLGGHSLSAVVTGLTAGVASLITIAGAIILATTSGTAPWSQKFIRDPRLLVDKMYAIKRLSLSKRHAAAYDKNVEALKKKKDFMIEWVKAFKGKQKEINPDLTEDSRKFVEFLSKSIRQDRINKARWNKKMKEMEKLNNPPSTKDAYQG